MALPGRRALGWVERRVFGHLHAELDDIRRRLEAMGNRLDEVQALLESTAARAAAASERSLTAAESDARTARRFEEIERMLGATPPRPR